MLKIDTERGLTRVLVRLNYCSNKYTFSLTSAIISIDNNK